MKWLQQEKQMQDIVKNVEKKTENRIGDAERKRQATLAHEKLKKHAKLQKPHYRLLQKICVYKFWCIR